MCLQSRHLISTCVYTWTKTLALMQLTGPCDPAHGTPLSRQCFYRPHKGQQNMASFAMYCPSAPGYQQETSFAEQEVLLSNWPKVIQWEPFFLPMRAQLFWERLYKRTRRASVRQSMDEVVGRGFLVNWELSNAKGFFGSLQATNLLPKTFHCSWLAC